MAAGKEIHIGSGTIELMGAACAMYRHGGGAFTISSRAKRSI